MEDFTEQWSRRAIGKYVKTKNGSVKDGVDYQTTARSSEPPFPDLGNAVTSPAALGVSERANWSEYCNCWPNGGIYLRPIISSTKEICLVASRIAARAEDLDRPGSRYYVEVMHAARFVRESSFKVLPHLASKLMIDPQLAFDSKFSPLLLNSRDEQRLPENWFKKCQPIVTALASGKPFLLSDRSESVEDFFLRSLCAVCCLPATLRWRIPIAAGVYQTPDNNRSRIQCTLAFDGYTSADEEASLNRGRCFSQWLQEELDGGKACETWSHLVDFIAKKFPTLSHWDRLDPAEPIEKSIKILGEIEDLQALKRWVPKGSRPPKVDQVSYLQRDVLSVFSSALASQVDGYEDVIADLASENWKEAWGAYVGLPENGTPEMRALAILLGGAPFDPEMVARYATDLRVPTGLWPSIASRISREFKRACDAEQLVWWKDLLACVYGNRAPGWLFEWAKRDGVQILWAALDLHFEHQINVTEDWNITTSNSSAYVVRELILGHRVDVRDFEALIHTNLPLYCKTANQIVEQSQSSNPELALALAIEFKLENLIDAITAPDMLLKSKVWSKVVVAVASVKALYCCRLAEGILLLWENLDLSRRRELKVGLEQALGPIHALLYGEKFDSYRPVKRAWVWPHLRNLAAKDEELRDAVIRLVMDKPNIIDTEFKRELLTEVLNQLYVQDTKPKGSSSLRFAFRLAAGRVVKFESFSEVELKMAECWAVLFESKDAGSTSSLVLTEPSQFPTACVFRKGLSRFPPSSSDEFWREWLRLTVKDDQERALCWECVKKNSLANSPMWRLMSGWKNIDALVPEELALFEKGNLYLVFWQNVFDCQDISKECVQSVLSTRGLRESDLAASKATVQDLQELITRCRPILREKDVSAYWTYLLQLSGLDDLARLRREIEPSLMEVLARPVTIILSSSQGPWLKLAVQVYRGCGPNTQVALKEILKRQIIKAESDSNGESQ